MEEPLSSANLNVTAPGINCCYPDENTHCSSLQLLLLALGLCGYHNPSLHGGNSSFTTEPPRPRVERQAGGYDRLSEVYTWRNIEFLFPDEVTRNQALQSGTFVPTAALPIGIGASGNRVFITTPRWRRGIAATLSTVPFPSQIKNPPLSPYPDWSWHNQVGNCDALSSAFRAKTDQCGRLWVLDTGWINTLERIEVICPPQIVVFDLSTDQMIYRYRFPKEVLKEDSLLIDLSIEEIGGRCGSPTDVVVYVADVLEFGIIVLQLSKGLAYRVVDKTMYPSPEAGTITVNGESFEQMDGVLALALGPRSANTERTLFFSSLASFQQRWVSTWVLKNESVAHSSPRAFMTGKQPRPGRAVGIAMALNGVLFFGLLDINTIACWDSRKPYTPDNIGLLLRDDERLQFMSSSVVDSQQRVWINSNRFQSYFLNTINWNNINFRIFMAPSAQEAVRGTVCDPSYGSEGPVGGDLYYRSASPPQYMPKGPPPY